MARKKRADIHRYGVIYLRLTLTNGNFGDRNKFARLIFASFIQIRDIKCEKHILLYNLSASLFIRFNAQWMAVKFSTRCFTTNTHERHIDQWSHLSETIFISVARFIFRKLFVIFRLFDHTSHYTEIKRKWFVSSRTWPEQAEKRKHHGQEKTCRYTSIRRYLFAVNID